MSQRVAHYDTHISQRHELPLCRFHDTLVARLAELTLSGRRRPTLDTLAAGDLLLAFGDIV